LHHLINHATGSIVLHTHIIMHHIKVFAELHWAVSRPELGFSSGKGNIDFALEVLDTDEFVERVVYEFNIPINHSDKQNTIQIELINKTNELCTSDSDHWVDIKNIVIDGIPADWLLHTNSCFKHNMPAEWVSDMKSQGFEILPEYTPGTELRLNGTCYFTFEHPYLIHKICKEWERQL